MLGTFARNGSERLGEGGEIVDTGRITELFDAKPVIYKQLAGVAYAYLRQELRVGLSCYGFKIPAKRIGHQSGDDGYMVEIDLLGEMPEGIIINSIDTVILQFGEVMPETYRREQMLAVGSCKSGKTFDQGDDPSHPFR